MDKSGIKISFGKTSRSGNEPLPLKILVAGDFAGNDIIEENHSVSKPTIRQTAQLRSIDKDNLDRFLSEQNVELYIAPLQEQCCLNENGYFHFQPRSLTDFTPRGIIENTRELTLLFQLLQQAREMSTGQTDLATFESALSPHREFGILKPVFTMINTHQDNLSKATSTSVSDKTTVDSNTPKNSDTPSSSTTADDDDPVSRLLDLVGYDNDASPASTQSRDEDRNQNDDDPAKALVNGYIRQISKTKQGNIRVVYQQIIQYLETTLENEVSHFLHNDHFQSIESLWRSLKLLVQRTNFREPIQIDCLCTARDSLLKSFTQLVADNQDSQEIQPYNAIVNTFEVQNSSRDLTDLQTLAEHAENLQTPVIFSLSNDFFGVENNDLSRIGNPITWFDKPDFQQWNALRKKSCSRWLVALCNRFVVRNPYEQDMRSSAGIAEIINGKNDVLWGNPVFLLSNLISQSFEKTGWPTEIQGQENGEIDDLALYATRSDIQRDVFQPLEFCLNLARIEDFATVGITALHCAANSDRAYIMYMPCVYEISTFTDSRYNELSGAMNNLPYQLLLALISNHVSRHYYSLRQLKDATELKDSISAILGELLVHTGKGAQLSISIDKDDDEKSTRHTVFIHAVTGQMVLNGAEVEFGLVI